MQTNFQKGQTQIKVNNKTKTGLASLRGCKKRGDFKRFCIFWQTKTLTYQNIQNIFLIIGQN